MYRSYQIKVEIQQNGQPPKEECIPLMSNDVFQDTEYKLLEGITQSKNDDKSSKRIKSITEISQSKFSDLFFALMNKEEEKKGEGENP